MLGEAESKCSSISPAICSSARARNCAIRSIIQPPKSHSTPTAATSRGVLFAPVEPGAPLLRRSFPPLIGNLQPLGEVVVERNGQPAVRLEFVSFTRQAGPYPWPYGNR